VLEGMEAGLGLDARRTNEAVGPCVLLEVDGGDRFDAAVLRPTKAQADFLVVDFISLASAPRRVWT